MHFSHKLRIKWRWTATRSQLRVLYMVFDVGTLRARNMLLNCILRHTSNTLHLRCTLHSVVKLVFFTHNKQTCLPRQSMLIVTSSPQEIGMRCECTVLCLRLRYFFFLEIEPRHVGYSEMARNRSVRFALHMKTPLYWRKTMNKCNLHLSLIHIWRCRRRG